MKRKASLQFTATGYDQFGYVLAIQPAFTWSLASGVGSVNSSSDAARKRFGSSTALARGSSWFSKKRSK